MNVEQLIEFFEDEGFTKGLGIWISIRIRTVRCCGEMLEIDSVVFENEKLNLIRGTNCLKTMPVEKINQIVATNMGILIR